MTGEITYNDLMYRSKLIMKDTNNGTLETQCLTTNGTLETVQIPNSFPLTSMALLSLFIFIIPIIMMNLFFGIAVNDVQHIMEMSHVNQNIKMVNVIWRYERALNILLQFTPHILKNCIKIPLVSNDMKDSE